MRSPVAALRRPAARADRGWLRVRVSSLRLRRRLLVAAVVAALLAGLYVLWLRDSSFVAVDDVTVTGVTGRDAERIRVALASTAETMTTLHVDEQRLERAAAAFPVVDRVVAEPEFPHGMTIRVIEHRAVAIAEADGERQPLAADGSVLAGLPAEGDLPTIDLHVAMPERQLGPGAARAAARVAGGAPPAIARRVEGLAWEGEGRGVVAQLESGTELVFGGPDRVVAKWAGVLRVLAEEESAGAAYVDVRIPERPVVGGLPAAPVATPIYPQPTP
jgi:cell division protein FtsQ